MSFSSWAKLNLTDHAYFEGTDCKSAQAEYLIEQGISENNINVEEVKGVERKININGVFDIEVYKITVN